MQILTSGNIIVMYGEKIEKGIYDADPSRELYQITNGENVGYAVTDGFEVYNVDSIPEDFTAGKYCYEQEKGVYSNPDYVEPINVEQEVRKHETQIEEINDSLSAMAEGILTVTGGTGV